MPFYRVTWMIMLAAPTPEAAAKEARKIQLDPDLVATVFEVSGGGVNRKIGLGKQEK